MPNIKNAFQKINKTHLTIAGVLLLVLFAVFLLWFNNSHSMQAGSTVNIELHFEGEYLAVLNEKGCLMFGNAICYLFQIAYSNISAACFNGL